MSQNYKGLFADWEIAIAKKVVIHFKKKWQCLEREGFDDLLQECLIQWLFSRDKYNSSTGVSEKTFMARIVRNRLGNIVENATAKKRKIFHDSVSLDQPLGNDEDALTLKDKIPNNDNALLSFRRELKIDLSKVFPKLTPQQRKLCRLLGEEGLTINEASKHFKKHRSNIYREINRLKKLFEKQGLREYLE